MNIGKIIKKYRTENNLSLREFAIKCGSSHSYIAMLENEKNSKTGEPIIPTLTMLKKISQGLGISLNELLSVCDDIPVSLAETENEKSAQMDGLTEKKKKLIDFALSVPEDKVELVLTVMKSIVEADL
jgi:transcriptional regulator with XRE-family HTH domain